jgi:hypothetical protein
MSSANPILVAVTAASLAIAGFTLSSSAQQDKSAVTELKANEGIYVDPATFAILKGVSKTNPAGSIVKLGAREVGNGAIIFRVGDKLYLADAAIGGKSLLNAFWEEHDRQRP